MTFLVSVYLLNPERQFQQHSGRVLANSFMQLAAASSAIVIVLG